MTETDDTLTRDFRVYQRTGGHRYSLDDVLTAREALRTFPEDVPPLRCLDLGCGIGSVLLMLAWKTPRATFVGIEAQDESFALAQRNVERNQVADRVTLVHGDLRTTPLEGTFDRITGTPPYMPPGTGTPSPDPQRAHARVELRGGIEDYVAAASKVLAPEGAFVTCMDARATARAEKAASAHDLHITRRLDAIPREGESPLFTVMTMYRRPASPPVHEQFLARASDGSRTAEHCALRAFFGLPSEAQ